MVVVKLSIHISKRRRWVYTGWCLNIRPLCLQIFLVSTKEKMKDLTVYKIIQITSGLG